MTTKFALESLGLIEERANTMHLYTDDYPDRDDALLAVFDGATRDEKLAFIHAAINVSDALQRFEDNRQTEALSRDLGMKAIE